MKILIMSDTHFNKGFSMTKNLLQHIPTSDIIVHCGDFTSVEFYNFLNSSNKLIAVRGNNDHLLADILEMEKKFEVPGFKIAVLHGHFVNLEMIHHKYSDSDIIIFGHTHHPSVEDVDGQLIINPGSLTSNRYVEYNTFMVLDLFEGQKPVVNIYKSI